ncbi:hypothetical protein SPH9361_01059 [Sphingobium sp. CECT 9361]|jgi:hypothetical protein|nr:hypothetical protein SPH9361_01059 [Sphingobium sp. CECT 9361]
MKRPRADGALPNASAYHALDIVLEYGRRCVEPYQANQEEPCGPHDHRNLTSDISGSPLLEQSRLEP